MHEMRLKTDGSLTNDTDVSDYALHLSSVSQPHFHHKLFSLVLCNLQMKQKMVHTAGWCVRNKTNAQMLAKEITADDVTAATQSK